MCILMCILLSAELRAGRRYNYSHAHAMKMSFAAPCTNHLVECTLCEPEQNKQAAPGLLELPYIATCTTCRRII